MTYASGTSVPVERSMAELEKLLKDKGAQQFYRGFDEQRAIVGFKLGDRLIKFELPLPTLPDWDAKKGHRYGKEAAMRRVEQQTREKWRALVLSVKAKLVGVEAGVESLEEAFLAHVVTPNGQTVYEHVRAPLADGYSTGTMPRLLPGPST